MALFTRFSRKIVSNTLKLDLKSQTNAWSICLRLLNYSSKEYDGNPDPGPVFISKEVQSVLKALTRIDLSKVYRKQQLGARLLQQPIYTFMTDEQLEQVLKKMKDNVDNIIQMPPIVPVRKPINRILSKDPALQGLETSNMVFTDISYGVRDSERVVLLRDTDGTLKEADWELRDRINQTYFPRVHRYIKIPTMFADDRIEDLLKRGEYKFILDRTCLQFEPNDPLYQKVASITYQHINDNNAFDVLRSTRHFGGFAFFLAWHKNIDNLLLELMETEHIDEANALVELYGIVHKIQFKVDGDIASIEEFIKEFANKKGALELALQAYRNTSKRKQELEEGIKKAHGLSA